MSLYENFRAVCASKGTTLSTVLLAIGRPTGSVSGWKAGASPSLETVIQMADYLGVSLEEMVYGKEHIEEMRRSLITEQEYELLDVFSRVPDDKKEVCIDFLRTHISVPEKNANGKMA